MPAPLILKETVGPFRTDVQQRTVEQTKNQERDQERIAAQRVDIPAPPVMEESVTVEQIIYELHGRIAKQRVNTPSARCS